MGNQASKLQDQADNPKTFRHDETSSKGHESRPSGHSGHTGQLEVRKLSLKSDNQPSFSI